MNRNKLLVFLLIFVVLVVVFLLLRSTSDDTQSTRQSTPVKVGTEPADISEADRDTYVNTISTLNQRNLDLGKRLARLEEANQDRPQNDAMVDELIAKKVDEQSKVTFDEYKQRFNDLLSFKLPTGSNNSKRYSANPAYQTPTTQVPTDDAEGLGFDSLLYPNTKISGSGKFTSKDNQVTATELQSAATNSQGEQMVLITPYTRVAYTDDKQDPVPVTITGEPIRPEKDQPDKKTATDDKGERIPFYTIPRNATLFSNTTLTALLGIVPNVQGSVIDPIRFKIITGATNLASNGHFIPGIRDIVWSGIAIGNRELSCVRGEVHSVTFTFDDGRVYTQSSTRDGNTTTTNVRQILGYISDTRGVPCLKGQLITNAQDYLTDRIIASGIGSTAEAFAQTQETTVATGDGSTQTFFSGDEGDFIAGRTLSGSLSELTEYLRERQRNAVDLVYLDGGKDVVLHVEDEITIDYLTNGRKLDYANRIPGQSGSNIRASFD